MVKYLGIILLLFVMTLCEASTTKRIPLTEYFSETWNTRTGLPHNSINSITQTKDGYLWIATWEGLTRFNGREFKLFTRTEIKDLPDSGLRVLSAQTNGDLYIAGSRGGISELKKGQWHTQTPAQSMVNHLLKIEQGGLWLALENNGVFYRALDGTPDQKIIANVSAYRVIEDNSGVIWAATSAGLYKIVNKQATLVGIEFGLPNASVYTLMLNSKGQLIVGSEQGAWQLDNGYFSAVDPSLNQESISSLLEDNNGDLWLGTINKGIFRLSPDGVEQLSSEQGLPTNRILSLLQDRENSVWVGTNAGLYRLREAPFSSWTKKRGLAGDYVRTVMSHSDGSLWIGSSSGLNRIVNNEVQTFSLADNNSPLSVLSLYEGEKGQVWLGTYTSGLLKVQGDKVIPVLSRGHGLGSNEVRAILLDSKKRLWVGTAVGITRINADGTLDQFSSHVNLPSRFILDLNEDMHGNIWIGTGVGVAVINIDTDEMRIIKFPTELEAEYAFGFYTDNNYVWMATDRGLVRYDQSNASMTILGKNKGLPVDKLFQVVPQGDSFWLSSNRGIIEVKQADVNHILDTDLRMPLPYQLFDEGDGMLSAQANGGSNPAATKHSDGTVWFATARGAAMVTPERLHQASKVELPTVIESFEVDGQAIHGLQTGKPIVLPPDVSRLSFQYAGLSFIMPQRLVFQTKLKGYSQQWVDRNQMTVAEYTNLPPGQYTFMVRAAYPNGEWQNNQQLISFEIKSHLWQTISFKLFMLAVSVIIIFVFYKYRLYHFKKIETELTNRVEQQTKDLQQQADAFSYQATHDQLTELPNRRAFDAWLAEHFAEFKSRDKILAVAILDIDHFKRINDGWSHLVGDQVICKIAEILKSRCEGEQEIARWGGEEFTLLFPNKTAEQAKMVCELLRQDIATCDFSKIAQGLIVTASFGVSDSTAVVDYDRLLSGADQALYKAKNNGRNRTEVI
jgi:diguanylate cyclase (GGDEF)-like protein